MTYAWSSYLSLELKTVTSSLTTTTQQLEDLQLKYNQLEASTHVEPVDTESVDNKNQELDDVTEKLIQLKIRVHDLEETNESLKEDIAAKDKEIEKLLVTTPSSPPDDTFDSPSRSESHSPTGSENFGNISI